MKILFWNLSGNANEKWVKDTINEHDVDIALFAEYQSTSFEHVLSILEDYTQYDGYGGCEKITLLCKKSVLTRVRREQNRYTLYSCTVNNNTYNIAGIHLPSAPSSNSNDRKNTIRDIVQDILEQENTTKNRSTIVIGDFNCNPFDEEIIQKDSFNAVLFKQLINKSEIIRYQNKNYRRFYNPIIHYLSEDTQLYGSYYYSSGIAPLYWNSFDQILVRKELVERVDYLYYIRTINGKALINETKPNNKISDHLPLLVCINKKG